jgi:sugar/nucleoside kinase (ribokinase family)
MNRRETLFTRLGVLEEAPPAVPASYLDSKVLFLANTHPLVQLDLLRRFPNKPLAVCDTMDLWINIARPELMNLLAEVDGVIMNDEEAMQLTDCRNVVSAGREVLKNGPRHFVVVKKGEHGAILVHRDGVASIPAFPADLSQVIDPTGAGDTFAGGFMAHLARTGKHDFETLRHAMAAWRPTDDSCWPCVSLNLAFVCAWGGGWQRRAVTSALLAQLRTSGLFSRVAAQPGS